MKCKNCRVGAYLGHLDGISATAQELCVLWHQHGAGIVSRSVEERVGGTSCGRGAQGAGELDDGSSNTRHGCVFCVGGRRRKNAKVVRR